MEKDLKSGLAFVMDYNEDRQVIMDMDKSTSIVLRDEKVGETLP